MAWLTSKSRNNPASGKKEDYFYIQWRLGRGASWPVKSKAVGFVPKRDANKALVAHEKALREELVHVPTPDPVPALPVSVFQPLRDLPREVHAITQTGSGAWVVGSAADPNRTEAPKDYDILVSWADWTQVSLLLPHLGELVRLARFGGISLCTKDGVMLDVWPDDLGNFLLKPMAVHAWHPKSMTRIQKVLP